MPELGVWGLGAGALQAWAASAGNSNPLLQGHRGQGSGFPLWD